MANTTARGVLRRDLGRLEAYATIVGALVGSGIFVVTAESGATAGPGVILAYLILGPIILSTTMAYSVYLSTPLGDHPGGAYLHMSRTHGFFFLGYILGWLKWVAFIGALSVLSLSLAQYVTAFFPSLPTVPVAIATVVFFYLVNLVGVKYYGRVQTAMFVLLIVAILLLLLPGFFAVEPANLQPFLPFGTSGVVAVLVPLFFSFAGFESLAQTAGETREARTTLPRVFALGALAAMLIYVLISLVMFGVVPYGELSASQAPITLVASQYLPVGVSVVVTVGAIMAFTTTINSALMVPPRLLYVMAEDRVIPRFIAHVNGRFRTPDVAMTISTAVAVFLLSTQTLSFMLDVALQALFLMYGIHSLSLAALPFVRPTLFRQARVRPPVWLVVAVGLFSAGWMAYFTYLTLPSVAGLLGIWVGVGVVLFVIARVTGRREGFDYRRRLVEEWADDEPKTSW